MMEKTVHDGGLRRLGHLNGAGLKRLLAPALLVVASLAFFWKLALSGLVLARGDTLLYFYPYWEMAAEALAAGRVPHWNSHIFMGVPFLANSQAGFFYPLNWPFWLALPTPYAVSGSIVLHILLAAIGTYALARRQLKLSMAGALLAAGSFALGGYLTAQVEHVNQLQGLAWMPWLFVVAGGKPASHGATTKALQLLLAGLIVALQLLAGHTQTLFISLSGLLFFRVASYLIPGSDVAPEKTARRRSMLSRLWAAIDDLLGAVIVAALLGAVQLLPTLQLTQLSWRQGGLPLNEAVSFSLHPLLFLQSLFPHLGAGLFTEYVAYLPLTVLLLAATAAWQWRWAANVTPALALASGGLFLALGRFNPLYLLLAELPGFSYFRAPARWLALYALGVALLAGCGLDLLRNAQVGKRPASLQRGLGWAAVVVIGLIVLGVLTAPLARAFPTGEEATVTAPVWWQVAAWIVEMAVALWVLSRIPGERTAERRHLLALVAALALSVMFFSSRGLPYNQPTTPAAYLDLRPPIARLQSLQRCDLLPAQCQPVPDRLLSLSDIFFEPGDTIELRLLYGDWFPEQAFFDYLVAVKQKEIIAPNLPMAYGLASVDGFDGGILPLRDYTRTMSLVLPQGITASDGRLREYLDAVPEGRWLDLFGARYVITDKVGDEWQEGVFFDRQHNQHLDAGESVPIGHVPEFEATELWLLGGDGGGEITVKSREEVETQVLEPERIGERLWSAPFAEPVTPESIELTAGSGPWQIEALALVDRRDGSFRSLVIGNYRLIYSGDVKIYENLDVLPRAWLLNSWQWARDVESSVAAMADTAFEPRRDAVVVGQGRDEEATEQAKGDATIVSYEAEEIVLETSSTVPALLVLSEASYPGWQVTVDGAAAELLQVDAMFRGVFVPPGTHEVRFFFRSAPYAAGRWVSAGTLVAWIAVVGFTNARARKARRRGEQI